MRAPTFREIISSMSSRPNVTLLLGTDRYIGARSSGLEDLPTSVDDQVERRVGITPVQLASLIDWMRITGVDLRVLVVAGAGELAGFSDFSYMTAGATIISETDLTSLPNPPDVVHALKEPTPYESSIPGPFIRIGALHIGDFSDESGLAHLLKCKSCSAILDGSYVGKHSYRVYPDRFPIPIRQTMSVYAGEIAVDKYIAPKLKSLPHKATIVICGAGKVGTAACQSLLLNYRDFLKRVLVTEPIEEARQAIETKFSTFAEFESRLTVGLSSGDLECADALIIASFRENAKDCVCGLDELRCMSPDAIIVDVACDEGPSIRIDDIPVNLEPEAKRIAVRDAIEASEMGLRYFADTHLPRQRAPEASAAHGRAVLPYLATLLHLAAFYGGPVKVAELLSSLDDSAEFDYFGSLVQDLHEGLVVHGPSPVTLYHCIQGEQSKFEAFARTNKLDLRWATRSI